MVGLYWRTYVAGGLRVIFGGVFLDGHVLELARFENLTAIKAFNEFGVFVARNDLNARMLALLIH